MQIVRNNLVLLQNIQVSCMETTKDDTDCDVVRFYAVRLDFKQFSLARARARILIFSTKMAKTTPNLCSWLINSALTWCSFV